MNAPVFQYGGVARYGGSDSIFVHRIPKQYKYLNSIFTNKVNYTKNVCVCAYICLKSFKEKKCSDRSVGSDT